MRPGGKRASSTAVAASPVSATWVTVSLSRTALFPLFVGDPLIEACRRLRGIHAASLRVDQRIGVSLFALLQPAVDVGSVRMRRDDDVARQLVDGLQRAPERLDDRWTGRIARESKGRRRYRREAVGVHHVEAAR